MNTGDSCTRRIGITSFRRVIAHAEPKAESHRSGSDPQLEGCHHRAGASLLRRERLAIEYDGGQHKGQLAADNRRQNLLIEAGVHLLRFNAGDVLTHPTAVVAQVRALLG